MNLQNKFMFIIPAKGNSQRIKNKNLKKLNGLPLVEYTLSFLKKNQIHKNIYLSTENSKIKKISKKYNINIIDRPKKFNTSKALGDHVFEYSYHQIKKKK